MLKFTLNNFGVLASEFEGASRTLVDFLYLSKSDLSQNESLEYFWYGTCSTMQQKLLLLPSSIEALWKKIRKSYKRAGCDFRSSLILEQEPEITKHNIICCLINFVSGLKYELSSSISADLPTYGILFDQQIEYITSLKKRILDYACGTGYALDALIRSGVDGYGFDSGFYKSRKQITHDFLYHPRRISDNKEALALLGPETDLMMMWPQPNEDYPVEVLEAHRAKGGKRFIFMPGAYGADHDSSTEIFSLIPSKRNYYELLVELFTNWQPVISGVPYHPLLGANNIYVFEAS